MRKRTKIIIVGSVLSVILAFIHWQPSLQLGKPDTVEFSNADYYFKQVTVKQFDPQGRLINRLQAEKMEHFKLTDASSFINPKILFINQSGAAWQIQSNSGQLDHTNNQLTLDDDAAIFQANSIQKNMIHTSNLLIDLTNKTAATESAVSIEIAQTTTHAQGMFADFGLQKIELKSNVETLGQPDVNQK